MSTGSWFEQNNRYLAASLAWLRAKLAHAALDASRAGTGTDIGPLQRWLGKGDAPRIPDDVVMRAAADREAAASGPLQPALLMLARRFGLSPFERDILLMCVALELDPGFGAQCARAHGAPTRTSPTFGLALSILDEPSWDALSPHRPLRFARLLEVNQTAGTALTAAALRPDERIVNFLKGLNVIDERLSSIVRPNGPVTPLSVSQREVAEQVMAQLRRHAQSAVLPVIQLTGPDAASRVAVAHRVCESLERQLYHATADALPSNAADIETIARLWQRETLLLPVALYIDADAVDSASDVATTLYRFLQRDAGLVFLGVRETPLRVPVAHVPCDVAPPTPAEQREAWLRALPADADAPVTARLLAGQFSLNLGEIGLVASDVHDPHDESLRSRLWTRCRDLARPRLDQLAQRLQPKATWDDLVLPDDQMLLMRQIAGQVRERHRVYSDWGFGDAMNRGFGINALFAGESGTGKTMAAEVLANDLNLNLYRIDLSAVVSKYIGETEKNLRRLFDAAEQGGAILFFDEADALFGKRSEVKDSHDRYANIEINYLLQRIESFNGLAILATNMKSALDPAFMRRLRFVVSFPFPSSKERRAIWERALPAAVPRAGLDYDRLARMNVSGGNIHSIALNAAFAAAQNGQVVTMPIVIASARSELRKLERAFNEAEFR